MHLTISFRSEPLDLFQRFYCISRSLALSLSLPYFHYRSKDIETINGINHLSLDYLIDFILSSDNFIVIIYILSFSKLLIEIMIVSSLEIRLFD
jgi:hypothetical protein